MKRAIVLSFDEWAGTQELEGRQLRSRIFIVALAALLVFGIILMAGQAGGSSRASAHSTVSTQAAAARMPVDAAVKRERAVPPSAILQQHPELVPRLERLLPPGTNLDQAAAGFKDEREFLAAVHAASNLNLSLESLKTALHGPPAKPLAKAIQQLNPAVSAPGEVKRAEAQVKADLGPPAKAKLAATRK